MTVPKKNVHANNGSVAYVYRAQFVAAFHSALMTVIISSTHAVLVKPHFTIDQLLNAKGSTAVVASLVNKT